MDSVALLEQGVTVASMSGAHWVAGAEAAGLAGYCHFVMHRQPRRMVGNLCYRFLVVPASYHKRRLP